MKKKLRSLPLEQQLFLSFLSISVLLLLIFSAMSLSYNINRQKREIDKNITSIAAYIAGMDSVVSMLGMGYPTSEATHALDGLHETFEDLNVISVYNADGLRFYHTDRQEGGETFVEGEEGPILAGSAPYITTGYGTHGVQRRAFHAVFDASGKIIGFVTASAFTSYIYRQAMTIVPAYGAILFIMLPISILLSHAIVLLLRSSLMGHHPRELLELYLKQEKVLNAIGDGIIASDKEGTVIFANRLAKDMFPEDAGLLGGKLKELFPESGADDVLKTGHSVRHKNVVFHGRALLFSEIPIGEVPAVQGVLTILNDRTEIEAMADKLSGAQTMLDTLRALNHEFLNKLHVILGYLQTGDTEKAMTFIINSNLVSSQSIRQVTDCIRVSPVCALVIGKMMHAAELGILLNVTPDSHCVSRDLLLPTDGWITIVGNLLENAIEELSASGKDLREITLGIYCSPDCNIITCEDTGRGIPPELKEHLLELGTSSKGENRGTGLYLIGQITRIHHGHISIDTEEGEGTCFTLTFTGKETD